MAQKNLKLFLLIFLASFVSSCLAQPTIDWQLLRYGITSSVAATDDGGFLFAGSIGNEVDGAIHTFTKQDYRDCVVLKTDSLGNPEWHQTYGGRGDDSADKIIVTTDGKYLLAATTSSRSGDVKKNHGNSDIWIAMLDKSGKIEWQRSYGGKNYDYVSSVVETPDRCFLFLGTTDSDNGDVSGLHTGKEPYSDGPSSDIWVVKIDAAGKIIWSNCIGGSDSEHGFDVTVADDGGYIITGSVTGLKQPDDIATSNTDLMLVKLNQNGKTEWSRIFGGSARDVGYRVIQTPSDNIIVSGVTSSSDGMVKGWHEGRSFGGENYSDILLMKYDSQGQLIWQTCLGRSHYDSPGDICLVNDQILVVGSSNNKEAGTKGKGKYNGYMAALDLDGNLLWEEYPGGSENDGLNKLLKVSDNSVVVIGETSSEDGSLEGIKGEGNLWLMKLTVE